MAKTVFEIGDRVYCQEHGIGSVVRTEFPDGGTGEVVEVDFDRIGVKLVSISYTQLKLASTANEHQSADEALDLRQRSERTFVTEEEENEHYMGTHWDMFFNEPKEAFKQLPEIVPQAIPMMGWASFQEPSPYHRNRKWPEAICLSWPRRELGVLMVIKPSEQFSALESFFPFVGKGVEHTIM